MPRIPRKSYETCYFHVMVQGFEKEYIFKEDSLKKKYLELLLLEKNHFKVEILTYCIMGNHAHVLLYCDEINEMSLYMKSVNTQFAIYYNKQKERVGYVFRNRFLSEPIINEKHLYSCISYIHMNPVVAGIVTRPEEYEYSSYNDFIKRTGIVTNSMLLKLFGSTEDYMDLFLFIHAEAGEGFDFKDDTPRVNLTTAKMIIEKILTDSCMTDLKNESNAIQSFFCKWFLRERVTIYHIEKILQIDHRKVKKLVKI